MTEQIDDYFARQRLAALIRDDLEQRIVNHDAQKRTETEIKATIKNVLDAQ